MLAGRIKKLTLVRAVLALAFLFIGALGDSLTPSYIPEGFEAYIDISEGAQWDSGRGLQERAAVQIEFSSPGYMNSLEVQLDNNDTYLVTLLGVNNARLLTERFEPITPLGLITRKIQLRFPEKITGIEIEALSGDGKYSMGRVRGAFSVSLLGWILGIPLALPFLLRFFKWLILCETIDLPGPVSTHLDALTIGFIAILSGFVLFWRLSDTPIGTNYFDICVKLNFAKDILGGNWPIFLRGYSREPMMPYLTAVMSFIIPDLFLAAKAALASAAYCAIIFFAITLSRNFSNIVAMTASSVLIFSFWYTNLIRSGYRSSLAVLAFAGCFYGACLIDRKDRKIVFGCASIGLSLSFGLYSYTVFTVYTPIVMGLVGLFLLLHRSKISIRTALSGMSAMFFSFLLPSLPFLRFIVLNPKVYLMRQAQRSAEIAQLSLSVKLWEFYNNYLTSHLSYFGEELFRFDVASGPFFLAPLAILGIVLGCRGLFGKLSLLLPLITLLASPISSSLMSIGFFIEIPEFPRLILSLPCLAFYIALGAEGIAKAISWSCGRLLLISKLSITALLLILFVAQGFVWYRQTFIQWRETRLFGHFPLHEWACSITHQYSEKMKMLYNGPLDDMCMEVCDVHPIKFNPDFPKSAIPSSFLYFAERGTDLNQVEADKGIACKPIDKNEYYGAFSCKLK